MGEHLTSLFRNSRPQFCAQLVRIHVVTPKAPLSVTLMPRVQPCPDGPVFHPGGGVGERYRLPRNSCWVLRLPYVYAGEEGSHVPPAEAPVEKANYGRLLKGALGFIEEYE
jgi:protein SMG8